MTNLDVIKYLSANNPSRLAKLLDDIYCIAFNEGSSDNEKSILEDFNMWINQEAEESGLYYDQELEDWKSLIKITPDDEKINICPKYAAIAEYSRYLDRIMCTNCDWDSSPKENTYD